MKEYFFHDRFYSSNMINRQRRKYVRVHPHLISSFVLSFGGIYRDELFFSNLAIGPKPSHRNADNGPKNSGVHSQSLKRLVEFSAMGDKSAVGILSPYHSQYKVI